MDSQFPASKKPAFAAAAILLIYLGLTALKLNPVGSFCVYWTYWAYPYIAGLSLTALLKAVMAAGVVAYLAAASLERVEKSELSVLAFWFVASFAAQIFIFSGYLFPMEEIVLSRNANSFYDGALLMPATQLLEKFYDLPALFPESRHLFTNMPGKTLFYKALLSFSPSPAITAYITVAVSNAGALFLYFFAKHLFKNARAAFCAMVLYLLVPAKIYFFPLLNTVTPVFMFLSLLVWSKLLDTGKPGYAAIAGASVYLLMMFEPTPIIAVAIFWCALLYKAAIPLRRAVFYAAIAAACFFFLDFLTYAFTGFEIFKALRHIYRVNVSDFAPFRTIPTWVWFINNIKELLLHAGIATAVAATAAVYYATKELLDRRRSAALSAESLTATAAVLSVLATNMTGSVRVETVRLWIFLAALLPLVAAPACARNKFFFAAAIAMLAVQAAVTIAMVGFVVP